MADKGKDSHRENRGKNAPKKGGESHRTKQQGSNSGKPGRGQGR